MGIYIKGMEMPKGPEIIIVFPDETVQKFSLGMRENLEWAHAVELPPHGDLVEIDRIREVIHRNVVSAKAFDWIFDHATVIIPRE